MATWVAAVTFKQLPVASRQSAHARVRTYRVLQQCCRAALPASRRRPAAGRSSHPGGPAQSYGLAEIRNARPVHEVTVI